MSMRASATLTLSELLTGRCNAHEPHLRGVRKFRKSSRLFSLCMQKRLRMLTCVRLRALARCACSWRRYIIPTTPPSHIPRAAAAAWCVETLCLLLYTPFVLFSVGPRGFVN